MTDGPLKNRSLGTHWKKTNKALQNNAASLSECSELASDALMSHLAIKEHSEMLQVLERHLTTRQMEFDPVGSAEAIFNQFPKTPFLDSFQKELLFRISDCTKSAEAIAPALDAAVKNQIVEVKNRFDEEFVRAIETGEMTGDAYATIKKKIDTSFDEISIEKVRNAIAIGNSDLLKIKSDKNDGVDAGMIAL